MPWRNRAHKVSATYDVTIMGLHGFDAGRVIGKFNVRAFDRAEAMAHGIREFSGDGGSYGAFADVMGVD